MKRDTSKKNKKAGVATMDMASGVLHMLSQLLFMIDESVILFDSAGEIFFVNDAARLSFFSDREPLTTNVAQLFTSNVSIHSKDVSGSSENSGTLFPFTLDGYVNLCTKSPYGDAAGFAQERFVLRVCEIDAAGPIYMLVGHRVSEDVVSREYFDLERTNLIRANKRLRGALNIVLATLDVTDIPSLFSKLFDEISTTMEADATLLYLWEQDGFYLRGDSTGKFSKNTPRYLPYDPALERAYLDEDVAARLRLLPPIPEDLRAGNLKLRQVLNEKNGEILSIEHRYLPPFSSFMLVPVRFSNRVIALIEVGWRRVHPLRSDDARLLSSVGNYLSVQLAGAISVIQSERIQSLKDLRSQIHEQFIPSGTDDIRTFSERLQNVSHMVEKELDAHMILLSAGALEGVYLAELPEHGRREIPCELIEEERVRISKDNRLMEFSSDSSLGRYLAESGELHHGVLLDMGELEGELISYLVLRDSWRGPFEEPELDFLQELSRDVQKAGKGEELRVRDSFISQALQSGMKNELQEVEGIQAQAVYSSATASAFVGGDFYDLIRLPERRACVIMGDVSGKGVEAASVSAAVKTSLGAYAWEGLSPDRMVYNLNEFLVGFSRIETFATLFVGIIDMGKSTITYCSAGHPPAFLIRSGGRALVPFDVQSGFVGGFEEMSYRATSVELVKGDVLLLYTDGTTEARSPDGAFFGEESLKDLVMREYRGPVSFSGFCDRILSVLDSFCGHNLKDDVALLALKFDELGD